MNPLFKFAIQLPIVNRLIMAIQALFGLSPLLKLTLPKAAVFHPFIEREDASVADLWRRDKELSELNIAIKDASAKHLIVTGPSGVGKTTLVRRLYKNEYLKNLDKCYEFNSYNNIVLEFITKLRCPNSSVALQQDIIEEITDFLKTERIAAKEPLEFIENQAAVLSAWQRIERLIDAHNVGLNASGEIATIFIFDQIERFLLRLSQAIAHNLSTVNGYELYLIRKILTKLIKDPRIRTVFIIREDYLFRSIDFLRLRGDISEYTGENVFRFYICSGINAIHSPQAVDNLRSAFTSLEFVSLRYADFSRLVELKTDAGANPFLVQLTGYVIEHYYYKDRRVRNLLEGNKQAADSLPIFFDYLQRGFEASFPGSSNAQLFRSVLYTIAVENRTTGLAADAERVSALAHSPRQYVAEIFSYLIESGVVSRDRGETGDVLRFVHDILADYVLHAEEMSFLPELKDSIMMLSESNVPTQKLTTVNRWEDFIDDIAAPNIGLIAIWTFYIYGAIKLISSYGYPIPEWVCESMQRTLVPLLPKYELFDVTPCSNGPLPYFGVYIMHCLWVTYIYYMDRHYIQHVARSPIIRVASSLMAPIGSFFGVLLSFSLVLHVIPVAIGGFMYSMILIIISFKYSNSADFSTMNYTRGTLSLFNMFFLGVIVLLLWFTFPNDNPFAPWAESRFIYLFGNSPSSGITSNVTSISWLYVTVIFMIYYWSSLRLTHQSTLAAAARLALFDRSQILGTGRGNG